ncbi:hypothetical protein Tdes44962_MAKER07952, partial [Teratosphaeria destructans]
MAARRRGSRCGRRISRARSGRSGGGSRPRWSRGIGRLRAGG